MRRGNHPPSSATATAMRAATSTGANDARRLTAVQLATVAVVFATLTLVVRAPVGAFVAGLGAGRWAVLLYLAVVCTVFGFAAQTWGIQRTSPSHVGLLLGTEPVWAALVGLPVAHDRLGPVGVVGIVVTLAAVSFARRQPRVTVTRTVEPSGATGTAVPGSATPSTTSEATPWDTCEGLRTSTR